MEGLDEGVAWTGWAASTGEEGRIASFLRRCFFAISHVLFKRSRR
jgi:hypothetical protein